MGKGGDMTEKKTSDNLNPVTFARLPVFDAEKKLWGYELMFMSSIAGSFADSESDHRLSADTMAGTALALDHVMDQNKKVMVNFSMEDISNDLPYALPPGRTIIKISNMETLSNSDIERLAGLQKDGYRIAASFTGAANSDVFKKADIICLNIENRVLPEMIDACKMAQSCGADILADHVDNQIRFHICSNAGFSLFQGSFFKKPEIVPVKKVMTGAVSRFKLVGAMEKTDPDFSELAAIIQADVTISFRLLSYLNSASFGFRRKIVSIKDAITLLGWQNLKNWLRVVLLLETAENMNALELIHASAQSGKFLEQVGLAHDFWGFDSDSLFLLGMFSLLDALMNQPMTEIVKHLPLADKLKGALCMEDNNEYVPLLKLARYIEEADFEKSEALINQLGLDAEKVSDAYQKSLKWANTLSEINLSVA